jgi:hypothetical protein
MSSQSKIVWPTITPAVLRLNPWTVAGSPPIPSGYAAQMSPEIAHDVTQGGIVCRNRCGR